MNKHNRLAQYLKALGHPVRLAIIKRIIDKSRCKCGCNPCSCGGHCDEKTCQCGCKCGQLAEEFPLSQSTISQHIKELKEAGLIESERRKGDYTLNHANLAECLGMLNAILSADDSQKAVHGECCLINE